MPYRCRICQDPIAEDRIYATSDGPIIVGQQCPKCGTWKAPLETLKTIEAELGDREDVLRTFLAAHIRQTNNAGETPVTLTADWRRFAEAHAHTPIPRKLVWFAIIPCIRIVTFAQLHARAILRPWRRRPGHPSRHL
jgi:hypothetical protein